MTPSGKGERPSGARRAKRRRADGQPREEGSPGEEPGVLTSLPSTRPQRPSARRAAARSATAAPAAAPKAAPAMVPESAPAAVPKAAPATAPAKAKAKRPAKPTAKVREPAIPRQGFEAEESIEQGRSVQPPSGTELAASVAELFGELAQAGLSAGGRLLKETVTRLSGS